METSPLEERLRQALAEHTAARSAPPGLTERAERRGRKVRRRRRATGGTLAITAVAAAALSTVWTSGPAEPARRVAAATATASPAAPSPSGDSCLRSVRIRESGAAGDDRRIVLTGCPPEEAARLRALIAQRCPVTVEGTSRGTGTEVAFVERDLRCVVRALEGARD